MVSHGIIFITYGIIRFRWVINLWNSRMFLVTDKLWRRIRSYVINPCVCILPIRIKLRTQWFCVYGVQMNIDVDTHCTTWFKPWYRSARRPKCRRVVVGFLGIIATSPRERLPPVSPDANRLWIQYSELENENKAFLPSVSADFHAYRRDSIVFLFSGTFFLHQIKWKISRTL